MKTRNREYLDYIVYRHKGRTITAWLRHAKAKRIAEDPETKVSTWLPA